MGVDRRDWAMFASCFTNPVYADFSGGGIPAATISRADLVALVSTTVSGFTATQHISPNHVIEFDASDPGRAICHCYMYAQHLLTGSENGEFYLLRGSYTNHMLRTADGWRIERIIQRRSWEYGHGPSEYARSPIGTPAPPATPHLGHPASMCRRAPV